MSNKNYFWRLILLYILPLILFWGLDIGVQLIALFWVRVDMKNFTVERNRIVSVIRDEGIKEKSVLDAMLKVPRHFFVPKDLEEYAYDNRALPIGYSQTISQPYIVAFMTQEAQLNYNSRVLEIGTGSGYQTAILAEICKEVFTIEIIEQLSNNAFTLLKKLGYHNVHFKVGNGHDGWLTAAPFDAIIVTAKAESLPKTLLHQLVIGGRMIIPLQKTVDEQVLVKITKRTQSDDYSIEDLLDVRFVPMVDGNF